MSEARVAVVGCGRMGRLRAEGARRHGARVVAVHDERPELARALADELGARVAPSAGDLGWGELDAVFVCTPPGARGAVELAAAANGAALFVEKPVGLSAAAAGPLARAARDAGIVTAAGYMNRYRPSVRSARDALAGERVLGAVGFWVNAVYQVPWWADPRQSGGPVNEQATHLVDLSRFLLGEVTRVRAVPSPAGDTGAPGAAIVLELARGAAVTLFYSCGVTGKRIGFEAFTPEGGVLLDGWDLRRLDPATREPLSDAPAERYQVFHDETAAFLRAAAGEGGEVLCDLDDALRTQRVVDAIGRALRTGETVEVEPEPSIDAPAAHRIHVPGLVSA